MNAARGPVCKQIDGTKDHVGKGDMNGVDQMGEGEKIGGDNQMGPNKHGPIMERSEIFCLRPTFEAFAEPSVTNAGQREKALPQQSVGDNETETESGHSLANNGGDAVPMARVPSPANPPVPPAAEMEGAGVERNGGVGVTLQNRFEALRQTKKSRIASSAPVPGPILSNSAANRRVVRSLCFSVSNPSSDSTACFGNNSSWVKGLSAEAKFLWTMAKEMGVSFHGEEEEIVRQLKELEERDGRGKGVVRQHDLGMETSVNQ